MKASDLREKTVDELIKLEDEQRHELAKLKFRHASGQLEKTSELKIAKKNIARILTVLNLKRSNNAVKTTQK